MKQRTIGSRTLLALSLSMTATAPLAAAQSASFEGLGFFPGTGPDWSEAHGVSNDGKRIAGFARKPGSDFLTEPFLWQENMGMFGLGHMPAPPGTESGAARGISGNGLVVVGSGRGPGTNGASVAFAWTRESGLVSLGKLPHSASSAAVAASRDGSVVGGASSFYGNTDTGLGGWKEGTLFAGGATVGVGSLPGALHSEILGVSGDGGSAVGVAYRPDEEGQSAFRWTAEDGLVDLGDLYGGFHYSAANAVSADGSVIVGFGTVSFLTSWVTDQRACRWIDGVIEELPSLPSTSYSQANAVSANGRFVAGWMRRFGGRRASVWDDTHGPRDLHELMEASGVDMSDWAWTEATGISADGRVVVGWGRRNSFAGMEAWKATLP